MAGPPQPAQPPLVVGLVSGILVFCGLVVAGCMTLASSGAFDAAPVWLRWGVGLTALLAVAGGGVANFGVVQAVNLARRVELGKSSADSARFWAMLATNVALITTTVSGVGAIVVIGGFLCLRLPAEAKVRQGPSCDVRDVRLASKDVQVHASAASQGCAIAIGATMSSPSDPREHVSPDE